MILLFHRWDMLVSWRVMTIGTWDQHKCQESIQHPYPSQNQRVSPNSSTTAVSWQSEQKWECILVSFVEEDGMIFTASVWKHHSHSQNRNSCHWHAPSKTCGHRAPHWLMRPSLAGPRDFGSFAPTNWSSSRIFQIFLGLFRIYFTQSLFDLGQTFASRNLGNQTWVRSNQSLRTTPTNARNHQRGISHVCCNLSNSSQNGIELRSWLNMCGVLTARTPAGWQISPVQMKARWSQPGDHSKKRNGWYRVYACIYVYCILTIRSTVLIYNPVTSKRPRISTNQLNAN